jgi:hypothetical protein
LEAGAHVFEDLKAAGKAFGMLTTVIIKRAAARSATWRPRSVTRDQTAAIDRQG